MKDYIEPHFNDEQTLFSALRVVPLEKIEAKARHRRQWFLGGAFAIAMMLGAASALVASYLKLRNVPQTATELSVEPDVAPATVAMAESAPVETPVVESEDLETSETLPVTPKKESAPKRRVVTPHNSEPVEDRDTRRVSEEDELERIRAAVLYDQWEE